jgi:hypothetical protein
LIYLGVSNTVSLSFKEEVGAEYLIKLFSVHVTILP